ncbi:hypothetical protein PFISCL1PPCAC_20501 [Pristionchus fissidentatus]|uniref:Uncharacterized protein n=1 Tax=Pristionchus fissidentatus TaxID=1538716 RepID=A0AAV5WER4_9BILA|nr:hypothetical protein PFISCL1PPCAC_20501 [Pristionchus fissidentatus]
MELHVWPSDFGLPSIDPACLQFLACSKMCASPVTVVPSTSPWYSPSGEYPVVFDKSKPGDKPVTDFDKFVEVLRKSGQEVVIDGDLTTAEKAELDAYACLLAEKFFPALMHSMWVDDLNYSTVTQYWYSSRLSFPYSLYYVEKRRNKYQKMLGECSVKHLLGGALHTLNLLSAKLGDNKYFCGNKPTSLDAVVLGYLAPLLRLPLPNDTLQLHLSACPNLVRFVESTVSIYLPLTEEEMRRQRADKRMWTSRLARAERDRKPEEKKKQKEEEPSEDFPLRDSIFFALGAVSLSLLFAVHTGIIQVSVEEDEEMIEK